jgi:hypothetical protein
MQVFQEPDTGSAVHLRQVKVYMALAAVFKANQFFLYFFIVEISKPLCAEFPLYFYSRSFAQFVVVAKPVFLQQLVNKLAAVAAEIFFTTGNGNVTRLTAMVALYGCFAA